MADPEWEKQQLDQFRARVQNSWKFECACCLEWKETEKELGGVQLYRARSALIARQIENKAAPYALCKGCVNVAPNIRDSKVLERLSGEGLFG